jgi:2-dehydro-3-deoxygluconokinase
MPKVVTFGEVMMRLSPRGNGRFVQASEYNALFAGSEANVAASLAYLGISSAHVTSFPDNDLGTAATNELRQHGIGVDHIVYEEGRIGVYFIEHGASIRSPKIIYDRFDSCFAKLDPEDFDWEEILQGADWFHWSGITPAVSASAAVACRDAILTARKSGVKISGDINYRRNLWQYGKTALDIMPELIEPCDVIVAGVTDLENCLGISGKTLEAACEKLVRKYPAIGTVASTSRATIDASHQTLKGILWNGKQTLESREYDLNPIVDRVGAGDAFMAGLIFGFLQKLPDQEVIDFGTAACALKHTIEGDVNLSTISEINAVMKGENVGKLLR